MTRHDAAGAERVRDVIHGATDFAPGDRPTPDQPDAAWPQLDMGVVEDDRVAAPTLDRDSLPGGWEAWIAAEAEARACPCDYVAAGLIGAASAWIGNARCVSATADWQEPAHLWFALVGAPSAGKTPAMRPFIDVSRSLERDAEPGWRNALAQYERDVEAARALDETWRQSVRAAAKNGETAPDRPVGADEPKPPPPPRLMAMDSSTEEMQRLLASAPRGLLNVRDELVGLLGGFDRYGGKGADRAFFLECYNGGAYVCDRVKYNGNPVRIDRASLAIVGGMVPDRLQDVLAQADDGLAARLIYIWPDALPVAPLSDRGDEDSLLRRNQLLMAGRRLRSLAMTADEHKTPMARALHLDMKALALFDEVRQEAMKIARSARGISAGWAGKNPGRALRLALVFEMLAWTSTDIAEPTMVSTDAVVRAAGYLDYAGRMLDRVAAGLAIDQAQADAAVIAQHLLRARTALFNERVFYQTSGYAWARKAKRRSAALQVLEDAGWLRRPTKGGLGRPRGDWEVSPRLQEANQ